MIPHFTVAVFSVLGQAVPERACEADVIKSVFSVKGVYARVSANEFSNNVGMPEQKVFRNVL
jgi:hypothetical protein